MVPSFSKLGADDDGLDVREVWYSVHDNTGVGAVYIIINEKYFSERLFSYIVRVIT